MDPLDSDSLNRAAEALYRHLARSSLNDWRGLIDTQIPWRFAAEGRQNQCRALASIVIAGAEPQPPRGKIVILRHFGKVY